MIGIRFSRRKRGRARSIGSPPCNRNCFTKPVDSARLQSFPQPGRGSFQPAAIRPARKYPRGDVPRDRRHKRRSLALRQLGEEGYENIPVREQVEVAALIGDVADDPKGKPTLHIYIVLGTRDGSAKAGHLGEGHVRPTLEVIVTESPAHLRKVKDDETGLALIRPAA
jgi:Plants and Prokaryotes Conserved (PCC) domain